MSGWGLSDNAALKEVLLSPLGRGLEFLIAVGLVDIWWDVGWGWRVGCSIGVGLVGWVIVGVGGKGFRRWAYGVQFNIGFAFSRLKAQVGLFLIVGLVRLCILFDIYLGIHHFAG